MASLLPFQIQMLNQILEYNNCLTVCAKGLQLEQVISVMIKSYMSSPSPTTTTTTTTTSTTSHLQQQQQQQMIIVLDCDTTESHSGGGGGGSLYHYMCHSLLEQGISWMHLPKYITSQFTTAERKQIYTSTTTSTNSNSSNSSNSSTSSQNSQSSRNNNNNNMDIGGGGGAYSCQVLFITSRILIVDLLSRLLPIDRIRGLIIYNSHLVQDESHNISFIVRHLRQLEQQQQHHHQQQQQQQTSTSSTVSSTASSYKIFIRAFTQEASHYSPFYTHATTTTTTTTTNSTAPNQNNSNNNRNQSIENNMKLLMVQHLNLWPRFRLQVIQDLELYGEPDIVEIHEPMTHLMKQIESCIVRLMNGVLNQLIYMHPSLQHCHDSLLLLSSNNNSNSNSNSSNSSSNNSNNSNNNSRVSYLTPYDRMIRNYLMPVWNTVGKSTKQLIDNLKELRRLLFYLIRYDCVTFYNYLQSLKTLSSSYGSSSGGGSSNKGDVVNSYSWLLSDEANEIFVHAKHRLYTFVPQPLDNLTMQQQQQQQTLTQMYPNNNNNNNNNSSTTTASPTTTTTTNNASEQQQPQFIPKLVLEQSPKWQVLNDVLDEIESLLDHTNNNINNNTNINTNNNNKNRLSNRVLLLARDDKTCIQLNQFLTMGSHRFLHRIMKGMFHSQYMQSQQQSTLLNTNNTTSNTYYQSYHSNQYSNNSNKNSKKNSKSPPAVPKQQRVTKTTKATTKRKNSGKSLSSSLHSRTSTATATLFGNQRKRKRQQSETTRDESHHHPLSKLQEMQALGQHLILEEEIKQHNDDDDSKMKLDDYFEIIGSHSSITTQVGSNSSGSSSSSSDNSESNRAGSIQLIIESFDSSDAYRLFHMHRPSFVILYDSDVEYLRRAEMFKALNPGMPLRLYMIMFSEESVEHVQYVSSVQRETECFKHLIKQKAKLAIPSVDSLLSQYHQQQQQQQQQQSSSLSTRRAGGASSSLDQTSSGRKQAPTVIVDAREFRSTLPSLLNMHGIQVIPVQISVGDYIVTRSLCVERKSTSDLWQSFSSGRLFTQANSMLKHYPQAALLIQFEEKQSFVLTNRWEYRREIDGNLMSSKLVLLTIHFPKLKLLWSRSPGFTAQMFLMLKAQHTAANSNKNRIKQLGYDAAANDEEELEPDPVTAQAIGSAEADQDDDQAASSSAIEFLKRLPGINEQNVYKVMTNVRSLYDLSQKTLEELQEVCGKSNGKKLHDFLQFNPSIMGSGD